MSNDTGWLESLRESGWERVVPVFMDTMTGEIISQERMEAHEFYWVEGNGSCDCNRSDAFEHQNPDSLCHSSRYVIVDVEHVRLDSDGWFSRPQVCPAAIVEFVKLCNSDYPEVVQKMALKAFVVRVAERNP